MGDRENWWENTKAGSKTTEDTERQVHQRGNSWHRCDCFGFTDIMVNRVNNINQFSFIHCIFIIYIIQVSEKLKRWGSFWGRGICSSVPDGGRWGEVIVLVRPKNVHFQHTLKGCFVKMELSLAIAPELMLFVPNVLYEISQYGAVELSVDSWMNSQSTTSRMLKKTRSAWLHRTDLADSSLWVCQVTSDLLILHVFIWLIVNIKISRATLKLNPKVNRIHFYSLPS